MIFGEWFLSSNARPLLNNNSNSNLISHAEEALNTMCNLAHSSSALLGFALVDYPFQISVSMSSSSSSPVSHLYDQDIYFCSSADSIPGLSFTYFLHIDILHTTTIVFVQSNKQLWPQYVILLGIALLCNLIGCLFCRLSNISYLLSVDGIPWKVGAKI